MLPLMILSDSPISNPRDARATGKPVVFIMANIHAGEVEGKEAMLHLSRRILFGDLRPLLSKLIILIAPIYNADGNEKINLNNRTAQNGPIGGVGVRENSKGYDLNRDYMKLDSPEAQSLVNLCNRWDPHLTVDLHTTNGSYHGYQNFARRPNIIGTHWFQYYDEPQGGRADGEDYNMGLVDIYDQPYEEVVATFQRTNSLLPGLHAQANHARPHLENAPFVTIPRTARMIDVSDASLTDWDKDRTLMRGFTAKPPYVPFADIYLAWHPNGLYLATIGMDYMHPEDMSYDDTFPLSESLPTSSSGVR